MQQLLNLLWFDHVGKNKINWGFYSIDDSTFLNICFPVEVIRLDVKVDCPSFGKGQSSEMNHQRTGPDQTFNAL